MPDVRELDADELCDSGWTDADGKPVLLFSDQNAKTVDRHFKWMADYGLDGVALQRFAIGLRDPTVKQSLDRVLANVRQGAAHYGRVWFLMYDLTDLPADQLHIVVEDWTALLASGVTRDRGYQRHNGRPVLGLWGIGFAGRPMAPRDAGALLADLRQASGGLTIVGGVPARWREGTGDASPDPGWAKVWPQLDVISPWTVGRYADDAGADAYAKTVLSADLARAKALGVELMPVAFPGFSWANLMRARGEPARAIADQIPRRGGEFCRRQIADMTAAGARMGYTAMFDELDEGTAMFKTLPGPHCDEARPDLHFICATTMLSLMRPRPFAP